MPDSSFEIKDGYKLVNVKGQDQPLRLPQSMSDDEVRSAVASKLGGPQQGKKPMLSSGAAPVSAPKAAAPPTTEQFIDNWYDKNVGQPYQEAGKQGMMIGVAMTVPEGVGVFGLAATTPVRAAIMGILGAGVDAYNSILGYIQGSSSAPKTGGEAAWSLAKEGGFQAGAELAGGAIKDVAGKIGATAAKAREMIETGRASGMPVSGPEATGGGVGKLVQSLGQIVLPSKGFFLRMQTKFFAGLNVAVEDTVATFGSQMTQANAGATVKDGLSIAKSKFHEMSSGLYEGLLSRVEQATGKAPIVNFSKAATDEAKKVAEELGQVVTKYPQIMKEEPEVAKIMGELAPQSRYGVPPERMTVTQLPSLTVREAQALRSRLRDMSSSNNPAVRRLAARFEKVVDGSMRDALDQIPGAGKGTLKTELDNIDEMYHKGKTLFDGKAYSELTTKYPEQMAHSIGLQDVTAMHDVHEALVTYANKPEQWDLFRRMWVQDKLGAAELTDAQPGQKLAKGVTDLYDALSSKSKPMADEFFSDAKGKVFMDNLRRISEITKAKVGINVRSDSHLFVNWSIVHGILAAGVVGVSHVPALAVTVLVPSALVRVMYNKEATNLVVGAMEAAAKAGTVLTPGQLAQVARGVRVAFQQKSPTLDSGRAGQ